ncbi:MAG: glycosyltransferase family 4 protein [Caulobacteraceae bacterium]
MTAPTRRVAILQDSPDFGGHERAFLTWLPALLESPSIESLHFSIPAANQAFSAALAPFAHTKLTVSQTSFVKGPAEPFRAPLRFAYGRAARDVVARSGCDLVLMLQGRIENLATPMLWLPREVEVVSYLPMAHLGSEMGRSAALSRLTDGVKRVYYRRPQRIIVPSQAGAAQVRRAGSRGEVYVVPNVALPAAVSTSDRAASRQALGLAADAKIALFMGRFDTHQKGIDRLVSQLRRDQAEAGDWMFLFVGQGPGADEIQKLLDDTQIQGKIVSWTDAPAAYLSASDILLLPSRFEGVPLIMLEALQAGLPMIVSDIDVFREYLPHDAIHDFDGGDSLPAALTRLTTVEAIAAYRQHAARLTASTSMASSQQAFLHALLGEAPAAQDSASLKDDPILNKQEAAGS